MGDDVLKLLHVANSWDPFKVLYESVNPIFGTTDITVNQCVPRKHSSLLQLQLRAVKSPFVHQLSISLASWANLSSKFNIHSKVLTHMSIASIVSTGTSVKSKTGSIPLQ